MQTFLPYPDFAQSAACLDNKRLGKQRVECLQILKALSDPTYGWQNHPAVKMWRGRDCALWSYAMAVCREWLQRGYRDNTQAKISELHFACCADQRHHRTYNRVTTPPPWLGNACFHASHRSNLLRKDPVWYGQFDWTEPNDLPYVWPVSI